MTTSDKEIRKMNAPPAGRKPFDYAVHRAYGYGYKPADDQMEQEKLDGMTMDEIADSIDSKEASRLKSDLALAIAERDAADEVSQTARAYVAALEQRLLDVEVPFCKRCGQFDVCTAVGATDLAEYIHSIRQRANSSDDLAAAILQRYYIIDLEAPHPRSP